MARFSSKLFFLTFSMLFVLFISSILNTISVEGTLCHCSPCPDYYINDTCVLQKGGQCFTSVEIENNQEVFSYGCLLPNEAEPGQYVVVLQCKGHLVPHEDLKSIECCDDEDLCNLKLSPTPVNKDSFPEETPRIQTMDLLSHIILLSVAIFVVIVIIITILFFFKHRRLDTCTGLLKNRESCLTFDTSSSSLQHVVSLNETSSGSGSGLPLLVQRTIGRQINLVHSIGKGRYGEVWKGKWRDESVAVKVFYTTEEASWAREVQLYQTVLLRHDNILGFIASDIKGTGSWTQLLLVTDYHQHGSLFDFLHHHSIHLSTLLKISHTALCGLTHLHTEIHGTQGKPSIAHRDIKSKNMLVKKDLSVCIGDLGLAVTLCSETNKLDMALNPRQGTRRYMAPEILDESAILDHFESFKMADMYSMALVLWEVLTRCHSYGPADEYQPPYYKDVGMDPSFEEMRRVVCVNKVRPHVPERFHEVHEIVTSYVKLMRECWDGDAQARLSSLRLRKSLASLRGGLKEI